MIPVTQTIFGGVEGNCYAACLASILHAELDTIPNFCTSETWHDDTNKWLYEKHRLLSIWVDVSDEVVRRSFEHNMPTHFNDAYTILAGPAPRGFRHNCVGRGLELAHDPHPSRDGLLRVESVEIFLSANPWEAKHTPVTPAFKLDSTWPVKRINPFARPWSHRP